MDRDPMIGDKKKRLNAGGYKDNRLNERIKLRSVVDWLGKEISIREIHNKST